MSIWVWDLPLLILIVVGGDILLFFLTYLAPHSREGIFHEIYSQRKHPYRFTLWMAAGQSGGFILVYPVQQYLTPSLLETIGIVLFALFLLIGFIVIVFGVGIWNLERSVDKIDRTIVGLGRYYLSFAPQCWQKLASELTVLPQLEQYRFVACEGSSGSSIDGTSGGARLLSFAIME